MPPSTMWQSDALHLSTALAIGSIRGGEKVILFSLDRAMNLGASTLGMATPLDSRS